MNRTSLFLVGLAFLTTFSAATGSAQNVTAQDATTQDASQQATPALSISDLRNQAFKALQTGDKEAAKLAADAMVRQHPDDSRASRVAADIYLRAGKIDFAIRLFDHYLDSEPDEMPGLWQRGIALYFAGDYKRAAKQFEEHRRVNPNDVENAAWHFLCVAKSDSIEEARQLVLPAPNDPRIPMEQVHRMLTSGDTDSVIQSVNALPADSNAQSGAAFYADFYLGLYADAGGDRVKAREFLARAAKDAPHHYMGDVARVYAEYLSK